MKSHPKRLTAITAVLLAAALLAACGKSSPSSTSNASSTKPVYGGTLRIVANGGPEENLDPVPSYLVANYILEDAFTRQLLTYPTVDVTNTSGPSWVKSIGVVPDVATQVPTTANGGITDNGLVYTFHIRPGVDWDSNPPRPVTSYDFKREFQTFCNPIAPVGNPLYFDSTIVGFSTWCNDEAAYYSGAHAPKVTPANLAAWDDSHSIPGITTPNSSTIQFKLVEPAADFNNILAMPFDSARPVEYNAYLPGSAQLAQHLMSDGPYQITQWIPNKTIVFTRNPAWKQSTDPNRHQYLDKIIVSMGTTSTETALADMQADTQDLELDLAVPPTAIPGLEAAHDPRLHIWPTSNTAYYVVLNFRSPDAGAAMSKLKVREAIAYAIDKADIQKILGGPVINRILSTQIPPGNVGYEPYDPYPTVGNAGDSSKCLSLLSQAGYPHGVTLTYMYQDDTVSTAIYQAIDASLAKCNITLKGKSENGSTYFIDLGDSPQNNKPNQWDLATAQWYPDWFGNDGRSTIQPLFQTNCTVNTVNDGCYNSAQEDNLIAQALKAPDEAVAAPLWQEADQVAIKDVATVPLIDQWVPQYASSRVHSAAGDGTAPFSEWITGPPVADIWLNPTTAP
jgi:peptide/nickel transport system substrate-binding protein